MAIFRRNRAPESPPPAPPPSSKRLTARHAQEAEGSSENRRSTDAGDEFGSRLVAMSDISRAEAALQHGDDDLASQLLLGAARQGSVEAMLNLAALANAADRFGEAKFWFETAASLGNEKARQHLRDLERGKLSAGQGFTSATRKRSFAVGERVLHPALGSGVVLDSWTPSDALADSMIVQFSKQVVRLNPAELTREPPNDLP